MVSCQAARSARASNDEVVQAQISFGSWFDDFMAPAPKRAKTKALANSSSMLALTDKDLPQAPPKNKWNEWLDKTVAASNKCGRDLTKLNKVKHLIKINKLSLPIKEKMQADIVAGQQLYDAALKLTSVKATSIEDFKKSVKALSKWVQEAKTCFQLARLHVQKVA